MRPSLIFTSVVQLSPYHVAASRSTVAAFCSARTSVVEAAHVQDDAPSCVTVAYAGRLVASFASEYPCVPYTPFQLPRVVVSVPRNTADVDEFATGAATVT